MNATKSVDDRCYDLAAYFLRDLSGTKEEDIQELAEEIQRRCEDACNVIEAGL